MSNTKRQTGHIFCRCVDNNSDFRGSLDDSCRTKAKQILTQTLQVFINELRNTQTVWHARFQKPKEARQNREAETFVEMNWRDVTGNVNKTQVVMVLLLFRTPLWLVASDSLSISRLKSLFLKSPSTSEETGRWYFVVSASACTPAVAQIAKAKRRKFEKREGSFEPHTTHVLYTSPHSSHRKSDLLFIISLVCFFFT